MFWSRLTRTGRGGSRREHDECTRSAQRGSAVPCSRGVVASRVVVSTRRASVARPPPRRPDPLCVRLWLWSNAHRDEGQGSDPLHSLVMCASVVVQEAIRRRCESTRRGGLLQRLAQPPASSSRIVPRRRQGQAMHSRRRRRRSPTRTTTTTTTRSDRSTRSSEEHNPTIYTSPARRPAR